MSFFVTEGFTEHEISRVVPEDSEIRTRVSVYEFTTEDKRIKGRGMNSIELFGTARAGGFPPSVGMKNAPQIRFRRSF